MDRDPPAALTAYSRATVPFFETVCVSSRRAVRSAGDGSIGIPGSVWPAVLMHMVEDAFLNELLLQGHVRIGARAEWFLSPGVGLLNIALFAGIGVWLHRYRRSLKRG